MQIYADDITIYSEASTLQEAEYHLQEATNKLANWTKDWGLHINNKKRTLMCFTRKRLPSLPNITMDDTSIPLKKEYTFLGLRLDSPTLTWSKHIDYLRISCSHRLNIMKSLAGTTWGANRETLLKFYTVYIQSKILYGSPAYGSAATSQLDRLNTIQNTALRIATGAFCSSPIISMQAEAGLLPLNYIRQLTDIKWLHKLSQLPQDHPLYPEITRDLANSADNPTVNRTQFIFRSSQKLYELTNVTL